MVPAILDVHYHPTVPALVELMEGRRMLPDQAPFLAMMKRWNMEQALADMDAHGIAVAIQSVIPPTGLPEDPAAARTFVAAANEQATELMMKHPHRLGLFAALSMSRGDMSEEIAYIFDKMKADGIALLSHYGGKRIGDPFYEPTLAELDRRRAVVFVHPIMPPAIPAPMLNLSAFHTELPFEVTRSIGNLLFSGALARYPGIRFIFTHGGGAVPMLIGRWDQMARQLPQMQEKVPDGVKAAIRNVHFDLATVAVPTSYAALCEMTSPDRLLFGSDVPYIPLELSVGGFRSLTLSAVERGAIAHGNANILFPRFKFF
ncbi:amidohydrolase family protein [Sphingobium sp.]|uniref:amidohydrolase family protein n=1 Tax=Sphingobium sp. TaxID=1912891 RepID=UPI0028BED7DE|nr:amidohydrolase family protein [Sphingobium sp.]